MPRGTPVVENQVLINGTITVNSNYAYFIEFSLLEGPNTSVLAQVLGNFTVSKGDTIRVIITTENGGFSTLSKNFNPFYDSGLTTSGNISLTLHSGGTYRLVYNNYSEMHNYTQTPEKIVSTDVKLCSQVNP